MQLNIYTDGGYKKKRGSWAFYVVEKEYLEGGLIRTKKQGSYEAELNGFLQALIYLSKTEYEKAKVFTDHYGIWYMIQKNIKSWVTNDDIRDPINYWGPIWSLYNPSKIHVYWVSNKNQLNGIVDKHCTKLLEEAKEKAKQSIETYPRP